MLSFTDRQTYLESVNFASLSGSMVWQYLENTRQIVSKIYNKAFNLELFREFALSDLEQLLSKQQKRCSLVSTSIVRAVAKTREGGGSIFFYISLFLDRAGLEWGWRCPHSQFCTGMHENACYKACLRFCQSMKNESQTCQIISVKCCVYLYNNQTCQGIVNEIVREGSNAQTVNTLTLTLTAEALARSLFSSPLLLLVAWLLLSPSDHRSWCCEFQGRKKWQMPTEISWKVFYEQFNQW